MSSSSNSCNIFSQMDIRCENGIANIYKKDVTVTRGEWVLYSEQQCCNCSSSSGSSGSSGAIQTICCENPIQSTLFLTLSNISSSCTYPTSIQLNYNSLTERWEACILVDEGTSCYARFIISCSEGQWFVNDSVVDTVNCNPFVLTGTINSGFGLTNDTLCELTGTPCCFFSADYVATE